VDELPKRGDAIEAYLKMQRDRHSKNGLAWIALDDLLEDYRLRADTGTPLTEVDFP
jgi:hypothetical protein